MAVLSISPTHLPHPSAPPICSPAPLPLTMLSIRDLTLHNGTKTTLKGRGEGEGCTYVRAIYKFCQ